MLLAPLYIHPPIIHGDTVLANSYSARCTLFRAMSLTLTLLTWTIWRTPTNASKWRMGFNSAFKGLKGGVLLSEGSGNEYCCCNLPKHLEKWAGQNIALVWFCHVFVFEGQYGTSEPQLDPSCVKQNVVKGPNWIGDVLGEIWNAFSCVRWRIALTKGAYRFVY